MAHVASIMLVAIFAVFSPSPMMLANAQPLWHWPRSLVWAIGLVSTVGLFYLFPDGRFVPRWTRRLAIALLVFICALAAAGAPFQSGFPIFVVALATGAGIQIYRYRRVSDTLQRQQTKWVVLGIVGMVVPMFVFFLFAFLNPSLNPLQSNEPILSQGAAIFTMMLTFCVVVPLCFLPVTLAFSLLRYRLWDVDIIINRDAGLRRADRERGQFVCIDRRRVEHRSANTKQSAGRRRCYLVDCVSIATAAPALAGYCGPFRACAKANH